MKKQLSYNDQVHRDGLIWTIFAIAFLLMVPFAISIYYNAWPELGSFIKGLFTVAIIFWPVGAIEVITYSPMLGAGGSYLGFVTGNLTNLKVPCVLNALEVCGKQPGTDEGEVISTIAVAISSIVTTIIIALGVVLLGFISPILESPALKPAFDNILPALFGGLGVVYVSRNFKVAIAPMLFMLILFILVPSIANASTLGMLIPVGAGIAIGWARILFKKNKI